jgi:hypothetical protein
MPLTTAQVHLYAATTVDYQLALGAAAVAGIPAANVTGDLAWSTGRCYEPARLAG